MDSLYAVGTAPTIVDHGAGKSYLGFMLYDALLNAKGDGWVWGIDHRTELVDSTRALAKNLGFERMGFVCGNTADAATHPDLPQTVHMVTALHACDTATDDAIRYGLAKRAQHMVLVPCCQAALAAALRRNKPQSLAATPLAELWRHALHTREFGSQLTNVLRCLQLEAAGYAVTVTELVGWEHSMKNELIIASLAPHAAKQKAASDRLAALLDSLHLSDLKSQYLT